MRILADWSRRYTRSSPKFYSNAKFLRSLSYSCSKIFYSSSFFNCWMFDTISNSSIKASLFSLPWNIMFYTALPHNNHYKNTTDWLTLRYYWKFWKFDRSFSKFLFFLCWGVSGLGIMLSMLSLSKSSCMSMSLVTLLSKDYIAKSSMFIIFSFFLMWLWLYFIYESSSMLRFFWNWSKTLWLVKRKVSISLFLLWLLLYPKIDGYT